jgi:hypothetical protein
MKKIYQVLLATTLAVSAYGQTPIITMISDGDCSGGTPKVVELYAQGTVDFSLYSIEIQSNANTTWGSVESLASLGVITDAFVYLYRTADQAIFDVEFPSVVNTIGLAGSLNFNGDDRIRIVETATSTVIDQYGEEGVDGTGTAWEYVDGYAKRNNSTGPENPFVITNWTYGNGALNSLGVCQGGADPFETLIGTGTYTPLVVPSDPTILATPTSLAGFTQFVGTPSTEQTFEVSGTLLTDDITLTVTSGDYELSETSGGVFGPTITLTQTGGEVAATTIYVRLNGLLAASPSNGEVTLTSTSATDVVVTLEGQILNPAPTFFVSETALSGFTHFVGTPSAEQTFEVSGSFLTDDIVITAPGEYEVSLTSGAGFGPSVTLIPTTGEVANTVIYVRLNGAAANPNQTGDVTIASAGVTDQTIALTGETFEYVLTTIGAATTIDADGVGESVGNLVELRGIVHCIDFRGGNGYNVTVVDGAGDGIQLFSFNQVAGYESAEGDSLRIFGTIAQFNGLLQINAANIIVVSQGNATVTPDVVTALGENTESQLVTLENLTFVTPAANWPANGNVDVTDGTTVFTVRVVTASPLSDTPAPAGAFNITGLGGQFDNSSPYTSGYQIFPCSVVELCNVDVTTTTTDFTIEANAVGLTYQWVDCDDNFAVIANETNQSFTATVNGNYAVIVTDGACSDTSACVAISTIGLNELNSLAVTAYPNPSNGAFIIRFNTSVNDGILNLTDINGKLILSKQITGLSYEINDITLKKGIYFLTITSSIGTARQRVIIN